MVIDMIFGFTGFRALQARIRKFLVVPLLAQVKREYLKGIFEEREDIHVIHVSFTLPLSVSFTKLVPFRGNFLECLSFSLGSHQPFREISLEIGGMVSKDQIFIGLIPSHSGHNQPQR